MISTLLRSSALFILLLQSSFALSDDAVFSDRIYPCGHFFHGAQNEAVLLVLGDSNVTAADVTPEAGVTNVFSMNPGNGLCYPATDPLAGSLAHKGSAWTRLANKMVKEKRYDRVLLVPVMLAKSSIADWKSDGKIFLRVKSLLASLSKQQISVTAVIWQQGQGNDNSIGKPEDYVAAVKELTLALRGIGLSSPIYSVVTGGCIGSNQGNVYAAQQQLSKELEGVVFGPDLTDTSKFESADCGLTLNGLAVYSYYWYEIFGKTPQP